MSPLNMQVVIPRTGVTFFESCSVSEEAECHSLLTSIWTNLQHFTCHFTCHFACHKKYSAVLCIQWHCSEKLVCDNMAYFCDTSNWLDLPEKYRIEVHLLEHSVAVCILWYDWSKNVCDAGLWYWSVMSMLWALNVLSEKHRVSA